VAVAAIKGEKTMIELSQEFDVHPNQIKQWRDQLLEGATGVFGETQKAEPEPVIEIAVEPKMRAALRLQEMLCVCRGNYVLRVLIA
jgi:transposase-like protein